VKGRDDLQSVIVTILFIEGEVFGDSVKERDSEIGSRRVTVSINIWNWETTWNSEYERIHFMFFIRLFDFHVICYPNSY